MSTSELTTANGYYEAVVVVDSLKESSGGDGTDVLIGVEGLMFGHTGSGEHEWLDQVSDHSHGGGAAGIMCAYQIGKKGLKVLLIEKNKTLGKKILTKIDVGDMVEMIYNGQAQLVIF